MEKFVFTFALIGSLLACATARVPVQVGETPVPACPYTPGAYILTPLGSISGPRTALCDPSAKAVGPAGELYVLNRAPLDSAGFTGRGGHYWVTVYDSVSCGDVPPSRVLRVRPPNGLQPDSLSLDDEGALSVNLVPHVSSGQSSITVYPSGASGNVAPMRILSGPRTGLRQPESLAVDRDGRLYVVNAYRGDRDDTVRVFAPGAKGDAAPVHLIAGPNSRILIPVSLGIDRDDRLYVGSRGLTAGGPPSTVTVYQPGAVGDATPLRVLAEGNWQDGMVNPDRLGFGRQDSLYVQSASVVSVFAPRANGAVEPARSIFRRVPGRGFATIHSPRMFVLGPGDTMFAVSKDTVMVYAPGYSATEPPVRWIAGPRSGLRDVVDIALDADGWLYVLLRGARWNKPLIHVFHPGAQGDAPPARAITGSRTRLGIPKRLVVDRKGRLYVANFATPGTAGRIAVYAPAASGDAPPARLVKQAR